jgi:tRNA threonylcarbamoyladenosine biosynthesis protein TsaE
MSIDTTWQTATVSSAASEQLGAEIGARLKGGEVIELVSDLGGGKTTLTRGIARGAGSQDQVSSPTFTLSNAYEIPNLSKASSVTGQTRYRGTIYHFDFYRLDEAGIMADELAEVIGDEQAVVIVEWGDIVANVLPKQRLTINIEATGEDERQLTFKYPPELNYLIEGLPGQAISSYA